MWRHEKGKDEKGSVCERYARDTHPVIAKSDWMNVYFVVGVANAMRQLPTRLTE